MPSIEFELDSVAYASNGGCNYVSVSPVKTTNPYKHEYPHAKLVNIKLTSIARLSKNTDSYSKHLTK